MGLWTDVLGSFRKLLLMQDQLNRLNSRTKAIAEKLDDHTYRLVRLETIIELARKPRVPPAE